MVYFILACIVVAGAGAQICSKLFSRAYSESARISFQYGAIWSSVATLIYIVWTAVTGAGFQYSLGQILLGVLGGSGFVFFTYFMFLAFQHGPMSITIMFSTAASAAICILGSVVFHESIELRQLLALLVLFAAMGILVYNRQGTQRDKLSKKFILFSSLVLVFNTVIMFSQKAQPFYYPEMDGASFCVLVFGSAALLNLILFLVYHRSGSTPPEQNKAIDVNHFWVPCILTALCFSAVNYLSMLASTMISAALQFPIQNAGVLIVSTLASFLFFQERITLKKLIGMALGIVAIVFLG